MGEYEPDDSRDVTLSDHLAPGEPPRTGPREGETRQRQTRQGLGGPEPEDAPTARDALGKKQPGFAAGEQQEQQEAEVGESDEEPPLGK
jgi:hypothetical protein